MTKILIHQPEYLPWTHLFEKIKLCDIFVILDNVQYNRRSFQNRNQIKNQSGAKWLTVPIKYAERSEIIKNITIDNSKNWKQEHLDLIKKNYTEANYFNIFYKSLENLFKQEYDKLYKLNIDLIKLICKILNIKCDFLILSDMKIISKKSNLILDICLELNSTEYITGIGSMNYLKLEDFKKNNININFLNPKKEIYSQLFPEIDFIENLSVIDKIFNKGLNII
tara:strand:- start:1089 stop:1760 length:672 start_codon:yes stop_codon:yes gene_type:complete